MNVKTYTATVEKITKYTEHSLLIRFSLPEKMSFSAGQFVMVQLNGVKKPFSISSPPSDDSLELLIRMHDEGLLTPHLWKLSEGDHVEIIGPYGKFGVVESENDEIVFISAGTGVAPFHAMIQDLLESGTKKKVSLIFGFRENYFFEEVFTELAKKYPNFTLHPSCSGDRADWTGLRGRVTEHLKELLGDGKGKDYYICGPKPMVEDTEKHLKDDLDVDATCIHVERW